MPRKWKEREVEELKRMIEESPVIGIISMHQMPAPQLQEMRKDLYGKAEIRMSRKTLMKLAMEKADKENIQGLEDFLEGEVAFIFTDMNPFRLYNYLQENKSSAPAKPGDVAPNNIVVKEGSTGIDPGPAIGKLQSAGIKTSIEEGKIYVDEESVVAEEGEEITPELAEALKMLEMEPMEIGLDLKALLEEGIIFEAGELEIDVNEYRDKVVDAYRRALKLAVSSGHTTRETVPLLVKKAWNEAKSLALALDYPVKDFINEQIRKSYLELQTLEAKVKDLET